MKSDSILNIAVITAAGMTLFWCLLFVAEICDTASDISNSQATKFAEWEAEAIR